MPLSGKWSRSQCRRIWREKSRWAVSPAGGRSPAAVFLVSDDSAYITGQALNVNGGEVMS